MKTPSIFLAALAIFAISASAAIASPHCNKAPRIQIPNHGLRAQTIVHDRNSVMLGGLSRIEATDTEDKIPSLGKVPFMSRLFKNKKADRKPETIIMITPKIVEDPS